MPSLRERLPSALAGMADSAAEYFDDEVGLEEVVAVVVVWEFERAAWWFWVVVSGAG